jgi:LPPG:FO 2-phospho-L-lactate transferase
MMASLGEEPTALGVARRYCDAGLLDTFVVDKSDEGLAPAIRALGLETLVTETVMVDADSRASLAREMLASGGRSGASGALKRRETPDQITLESTSTDDLPA